MVVKDIERSEIEFIANVSFLFCVCLACVVASLQPVPLNSTELPFVSTLLLISKRGDAYLCNLAFYCFCALRWWLH